MILNHFQILISSLTTVFMNIEQLFEKCMKGGLRKMIKGGLVYKYFINPFFVWCDAHAPKEEMDPESPYMNLIFKKGRDHEDDVCREMYPGGVDIDPTKHGEAFKESLAAMASGEKYVKNGIFYYLPKRMVAVPDVLVKREGKSDFGDYFYEVVEIKSSAQIRTEHIMQAAYYTYMMGIIQGFTPERFFMVDGAKKVTEHNYVDYKDKVIDTNQEIINILEGRAVPPSKVGWPWTSFSIKKLKEMKHISLIPNMHSTHKEALLEAGVNTLEDFFTLNILAAGKIRPETMERYRLCAKSIIQGKHIFLDKPFLPEGKTEIFMDFEGVNDMKIRDERITCDYLIGALVRKNGSEEYLSFVSQEPGKEHEMLFEFLKFLKAKEDYVIYHFGSYEKAHMASMLHKNGIEESLAQKILDSMVDVLPMAKKHVVFPTHSYSLKELAKYLGFSWRDLGDAKDSIVLYLDYVENNNKASLDKIVTYNEDDCVALKKVKDFLVWGT